MLSSQRMSALGAGFISNDATGLFLDALDLRHCDYSLSSSSSHAPQQDVLRSEPLVISECHGFFDLSSRGEQEFVQLISNWATNFDKNLDYFTQLTNDILQESGIELSGLIDRFSTSIHRWFPVIDIERLRKNAQTLQELPAIDATTPLLVLTLLLFDLLQRCELGTSAGPKKLYSASKKLTVALISLNEKTDARLVEIQALIALYECSQGMVYKAQLTLSSALTMVALSDSYTPETDIPLQTRVSLLILDRPFSKGIERYIRRHFIGEAASFGVSPSQQLYTMAQIALATGRVLHHVYCSHHGYEVDESYNSVDHAIQALVTALMASKDSHSMYLCDIISLAICSLIVLRQSHAKQQSFMLSPLDNLALQTSCQMIWDTAKISFHAIRGIDVSRVSFIGMFCQLRGVHAAIDVSHNYTPRDGMEDMLFTMENFFRRWTIGGKLVSRNITYQLVKSDCTAGLLKSIQNGIYGIRETAPLPAH
ncbi:hypothetical protein N5P37_006696 [Trichoderma harzianum]|nr:hypothetical protein N5P37_006696 [Trichoderma harzianum]